MLFCVVRPFRAAGETWLCPKFEVCNIKFCWLLLRYRIWRALYNSDFFWTVYCCKRCERVGYLKYNELCVHMVRRHLQACQFAS